MAMLECPGVFRMPFVPDGWHATGRAGEFYELAPPDGTLALRISVLIRPKGPVREHEARDLLTAFAAKAVGVATAEIRVLRTGRAEQRAFSRFSHPDDRGEPVDWFAACIVWPKTMLMCTCSGRPGHPAFADAERMLASIVPLGRNRWRPWRR